MDEAAQADLGFDAGFRAGLEAASEVALNLENRWRQSAAKTRADGTFPTGWWGRKTFVARAFEQSARDMEAAANGIAAIRQVVTNLKQPVSG